MQLNVILKIHTLLLCIVIIWFLSCACHAQTKTIKGNVNAFKNLELNKIQVQAKKSGNVVFTSANGSFEIECRVKDKLIFTGKGFERTSENISDYDSISVKMIFKGNPANRTKALCSSHVTKDEIDFAINQHSAYNCYPCPYRMFHPFTQRNSKNSEQDILPYSILQRSQADNKSSLIILTSSLK